MMEYKDIKFVYDEPALVVSADGKEHLVIGDLHIGMELGLSRKGVHLFGATERMSGRINRIMRDFSLKRIIMLGDIKESVLYPEASEVRLIREFFRSLDGFEISIVAGNHDAHLSEIIGIETRKELSIGGFGFVHGNRKPDERLMMLDYIIGAHEHVAVRLRDENGAVYEQKAWAMYGLSNKSAKESYAAFNKKIRLISMPAFNELIMGTAIEKGKSTAMNPLLTNRIFSMRKREIFSLSGQRIML